MGLRVNGIDVGPQRADVTLLELIRETLGLNGTKAACERGECGSCTVLVNGLPVAACIQLACLTQGDVTTIEALAESDRDLREAFAEFGGFQCGFCTSGQIVHAASLVRELQSRPEPADLEAFVRHRMSGNLCRCTGYVGIVDAIIATYRRRTETANAGAAA